MEADMREGNILVADDDQGVLDLLQAMLHHEGFQVFLATNGKEAVEAV